MTRAAITAKTGPGASSYDHRNGISAKTVLTEDGPLRIEVPRDREGSFEPLLIPVQVPRACSDSAGCH